MSLPGEQPQVPQQVADAPVVPEMPNDNPPPPPGTQQEVTVLLLIFFLSACPHFIPLLYSCFTSLL